MSTGAVEVFRASGARVRARDGLGVAGATTGGDATAALGRCGSAERTLALTGRAGAGLPARARGAAGLVGLTPAFTPLAFLRNSLTRLGLVDRLGDACAFDARATDLRLAETERGFRDFAGFFTVHYLLRNFRLLLVQESPPARPAGSRGEAPLQMSGEARGLQTGTTNGDSGVSCHYCTVRQVPGIDTSLRQVIETEPIDPSHRCSLRSRQPGLQRPGPRRPPCGGLSLRHSPRRTVRSGRDVWEVPRSIHRGLL
jgi:hypothetical protein